jgi:hypothetical protein
MGRAGRARVERYHAFDDFVDNVRRVVLDVACGRGRLPAAHARVRQES